MAGSTSAQNQHPASGSATAVQHHRSCATACLVAHRSHRSRASACLKSTPPPLPDSPGVSLIIQPTASGLVSALVIGTGSRLQPDRFGEVSDILVPGGPEMSHRSPPSPALIPPRGPGHHQGPFFVSFVSQKIRSRRQAVTPQWEWAREWRGIQAAPLVGHSWRWSRAP